MKSSSAYLRSVMYDNPDHVLADLTTFFFPSGAQRFTTHHAPISIGALTWSPAHPEAPDLWQGLGAEIETFIFRMGVSGQAVAGVDFRAAALEGLFNGVRVLVQRARIVRGGTFTGYQAADLETVFDGVCTKALPIQNSAIEARVQSPLAGGRAPMRRRTVQAECPFALGDANCGVVLAAWQDPRNVAAGSTPAVVNLSASSTQAATGSLLAITSGAWIGATRVIRSVSGVACTLDVPFGGIEVGASCTVTKGCDKRIETCVTFGNQLRSGACPHAPADRE